MMHPLLGMGCILATLAGLLGGLTLYRRLAGPHPEVLRKVLHVGMGLTTLALPWLFDSAWPVVTLAVLAAALMIGLRAVSALREVGGVVNGVERFSFGEIYFPIAVTILWLLYLHAGVEPEERRLLGYVVPVLLLTLSDASAALVGVAYGHLRYATPEGTKTYEGSFAFFLCSFLCVHVPLLLIGDRGRPETLLISLLLAWLATLFEAIAWNGLDNLILPLVAHLLLQIYWDLGVAGLLARIAVLAGLSAVVIALAWWTPLRGSAVFGSALVGYICWALGGWPWLVPPLMLFVGYVALSCRNALADDAPHTVHAVVCVTSAGLAWLFLSRIGNLPELFYPFAVAFAANLGIIALAQFRFDHPSASPSLAVFRCAACGWLPVLGAYVAIRAGTPAALGQAAVALPAVVVAVASFALLQPRLHECPVDTPRWIRQGACAAASSALVALLFVFFS